MPFNDLLWKLWYPLLTRLSWNSPVSFLNYGYCAGATNEPAIDDQDQPDRPCIQLYQRVTRAIDLHGLDVLEVSWGHGGGASFVARYLGPRSVHGLDRNASAIKLCKQRHRANGLTFSCGSAMDLHFADSSFDVVLNIEASHCYPDMPCFLREVRRVLRPGGHFLYADFRDSGRPFATLQHQLQASALEIMGYEDISPNVVRGMQLNTEKYEALIQHLVPTLLQKHALSFAGVKGSAIYRALNSGATCSVSTLP